MPHSAIYGMLGLYGLTITTLWPNSAGNTLMMFFLFYRENRFWHFMQIVSSGDNLHDMSDCFLGKGRKIFQYFSMSSAENFTEDAKHQVSFSVIGENVLCWSWYISTGPVNLQSIYQNAVSTAFLEYGTSCISLIVINPCPAEWIKMQRPLLIFSQSDYLIWIVAKNFHT